MVCISVPQFFLFWVKANESFLKLNTNKKKIKEKKKSDGAWECGGWNANMPYRSLEDQRIAEIRVKPTMDSSNYGSERVCWGSSKPEVGKENVRNMFVLIFWTVIVIMLIYSVKL